MELKGRLKLIADKTPVCNILCDIGTDHAYIPIYLAKKGVCKSAIACDIKKGPLNAAKQNIEMYGLKIQIEARLGNGLNPLGENEADVIIIAGMGGRMIEKILYDGFKKAQNADALILQPMNEIDSLRRWLYNNGFEIYDESLTNEGEKIYNVIAARWNGVKRELKEVYYFIGEKLIENGDPLLERYLTKKIRQMERIISDMADAPEVHRDVKDGYIDLLNGYREILKGL